MAFSFDLSAAVGAIATLEATISTPSPGITTVYAFNSNPTEITNPALLPAIVHINRGPLAPPGGFDDMRVTVGGYYVAYDVESVALIIQSVPDQFPGDEGTANLFWKSILETFLSPTNKRSLATSAKADEYRLILEAPTYGLRSWPPFEPPVRVYWAFSYTHRFLFFGGGA